MEDEVPADARVRLVTKTVSVTFDLNQLLSPTREMVWRTPDDLRKCFAMMINASPSVEKDRRT